MHNRVIPGGALREGVGSLSALRAQACCSNQHSHVPVLLQPHAVHLTCGGWCPLCPLWSRFKAESSSSMPLLPYHTIRCVLIAPPCLGIQVPNLRPHRYYHRYHPHHHYRHLLTLPKAPHLVPLPKVHRLPLPKAHLSTHVKVAPRSTNLPLPQTPRPNNANIISTWTHELSLNHPRHSSSRSSVVFRSLLSLPNSYSKLPRVTKRTSS